MTNKLEITVDENGKVAVFMNGFNVMGVRRIQFNYEVGEIPSHEIEFISQIAELAQKPF